MSNRTYDVLKYIAQIFLPALGTLYFALAGLWNLPKPEEVVGTVMAIDVFLGVLLKLSSSRYDASDDKYDGTIVVEEGPDSKLFSLNLDSDPNDLDVTKEVLFKVTPTPPSN
jgi:hypothetical protein